MTILIRHLVIGLVCGLATLLFSLMPIAEFIELRGYDFLHIFRKYSSPPADVVIVAVDEPSFAELRLQWPWPRRIHGSLIDSLKKAGASVIAFDVVFAEPSLPQDDRVFADAMKRAGNVVLASDVETIADSKYGMEMVIESLPLFGEQALTGIVKVPLDMDSVVRRFYPVKGGEMLFAEQAVFSHTKKMRRVPAGASIWYAGPPRTFTTVSYYQALEPSRYLPANFLKGKIIIVGKAVKSKLGPERSSSDIFATPFLFSGQGDLMYGSEIQANMVNDLLRGQFVMRLGKFETTVLFFFMGVLGSFLQVGWRPVRNGLLTLLCLAAYAAIAYHALESRLLWVPAVSVTVPLILPYGVWGARAYIVSEKKRKELKNAFSHYLSSSVLENVISHPDDLKLGGKKVEATILFSDIAGFTEIAEKMDPEDVAGLLTRYFGEMTAIILRHKGTLDKFIGDAIMAFWGAPTDDADHALNACRAAAKMQERLTSLREELKADGLPEIKVRIGINSGVVIAGNMGSPDLFDYTVLGDPVNLASRLEGANKQFGTSILIGGSVYEKVARQAEARPLGRISVKGKTEDVEVYELLGTR